jgi:hypothetical protein
MVRTDSLSRVFIRWGSSTRIERLLNLDLASPSKGARPFYFFSRCIFFIILVSSMSSSDGGSIHVFVESYDSTIMYCEHMRKVTVELPASNSD